MTPRFGMLSNIPHSLPLGCQLESFADNPPPRQLSCSPGRCLDKCAKASLPGKTRPWQVCPEGTLFSWGHRIRQRTPALQEFTYCWDTRPLALPCLTELCVTCPDSSWFIYFNNKHLFSHLQIWRSALIQAKLGWGALLQPAYSKVWPECGWIRSAPCVLLLLLHFNFILN